MKFLSKFKKKKTFFLVSTFIMIVAMGANTYGKSISELKKGRIEITKNKEQVDNSLKELENLKSVAKTELDRIDITLKEAVIALEEVEGELEFTKELLNKSQEELEVATEERETQYEIFKQRFAIMYENGNTSYIDVVLEAESFSDMIKRVEYINQIIDYDNNLVDGLLEIEEFIKDTVKKIENEKMEIEVLHHEQKVKTDNLEVKLEEKNIYVANIENDEIEFKKQMDILDASDAELEKLIKEEEDKAIRSTVTGSVFKYTGGQLGWPVPGRTRISSGYISRNSPISGRGEFHTGLDIPAPVGTNVVAAEDGIVLSSGWQNGFGYTVVISHGDGLSTLYAHNSSLVAKKGDTVGRGDTVAKAGSTGYSTGPHCHFEVRINGKHTNPAPYLY